MKYTIITQRYGCHLFVEALLRSVQKYLSPDEIIVVEDTKASLGGLMHKEILKAKNDFFLMLDQDILIFDNVLVEKMYENATKPDVLASGAIDLGWNQNGNPRILVASCNMVDKKKYIANGIPFYGSEPCIDAFGEAMKKGQKLIQVGKSSGTCSISPEVFHLNQGFKTSYPDTVLSGLWKPAFDGWKSITGSKEVLDDYMVDDGADYHDHIQVSNHLAWSIHYAPETRRGISVIRLEDEGVEFLLDYYAGKSVDKKLAEELIEYAKVSTWLDHSHMFKGCFNNLYDSQSDSKYTTLYNEMGIKYQQISDFYGRYFSPINNYLFFVNNFGMSFYEIVGNQRVRYAGPYDAFGELNKKRNLGLKKYEFCQLSNDSRSLNEFFRDFNCQDWDMCFVSCNNIYANLIAGRVKQMSGVAVNIGDAPFFNLNDRMKKVLDLNEDGISYSIKDGYPNYGKRLYEKYLMEH